MGQSVDRQEHASRDGASGGKRSEAGDGGQCVHGGLQGVKEVELTLFDGVTIGLG